MENFATKLIENLRKERVVLEKNLAGTRNAKNSYLRVFDSVIFAVNSALETTTQVVPQAKITSAEFKNPRGRNLFNCLMDTFEKTFQPSNKTVDPNISFEEFASSFTTLEDALTELFRAAKLYDCMALVGDVPTMSMIDICNQIVDCETSNSRMHILENIMTWLDLELDLETDFECGFYIFNETIIDLADFAETSPKNVVALIKKEVPTLGDIPYSTTLNELIEQIVAVEEPNLIPKVVEELLSFIFNADETVEIDIDKNLIANASLNEMSVSELCDLITEYAACEEVVYVPDPHKSFKFHATEIERHK